MSELAHFTAPFIIAEIEKNKGTTMRVTRALVNGEPYVFIQLFSVFDGSTRLKAPRTVGKPISLKADKIPELIGALQAVLTWRD